jgi:zona occludens toxin
MLTIITGTPGAGKTLYTVWEEARKVPGSTVESEGAAVPRRLLSNIKNLLLEHEVIGAKELETWHEWARPGDVIVYDEVQEVWRPRSFGTKVPDCIAALETHRHKGVDIILITQHPMLVDPNIRRLCNRHLHLRRLTKGTAYVYEWDHCSNPGTVKTALQGRLWFHPKKAYGLYKSAQLHTKSTARLPRVALLGLLAVGGLAYLAPTAYGRITGSLGKAEAPASPAKPKEAPKQLAAAGLPVPPAAQAASSPVAQASRVVGCIQTKDRCSCFDDGGARVVLARDQCTAGIEEVGGLVRLDAGGMGQRPMGTMGGVPDRPAAASQGAGPAPQEGAFNLAPPPERVESLTRTARAIAS